MTNPTTHRPTSPPSICSLTQPRVAGLLARLAAEAEVNDAPIMAALHAELAAGEWRPLDDTDPRVAELLKTAYIPVSLDVGRLLYALARARTAPLIVEFGTSYGISTLHLAAAARDSGGRVITTEQDAAKAARARAHFAEAGLDDVIELREGDARETLRDLDAPVDLLFLDGWKALYRPILDVVAPRLRPGALVVADDLDIVPELIAPYLAHVRDARNGYQSVELPIGDKLELSVRA